MLLAIEKMEVQSKLGSHFHFSIQNDTSLFWIICSCYVTFPQRNQLRNESPLIFSLSITWRYKIITYFIWLRKKILEFTLFFLGWVTQSYLKSAGKIKFINWKKVVLKTSFKIIHLVRNSKLSIINRHAKKLVQQTISNHYLFIKPSWSWWRKLDNFENQSNIQSFETIMHNIAMIMWDGKSHLSEFASVGNC